MSRGSPPTRPAPRPPGGPERIAKLLARAGVASRREVERMIAEGRVALDGEALASPALTLSSLRGVTVDGRPVAAAEPARLFLFHKPGGVLTTERDPRGRPTIYDRLPPGLPRLVPVGRLDLATEGLLLMTTDGELKRQLELPATGVERAYRARAYGPVTQAQLESLIEGVEVEGVRYGPINANLERRTGANVWIEMILTEGKNREVRRVLEYLGLRVGRLIRTRYGPFVLGDMAVGEVGEVRAADLAAFRRSLDRGRPMKDPVDVRARTAPAPSRPAADAKPPRAPRPAVGGRDRSAPAASPDGRAQGNRPRRAAPVRPLRREAPAAAPADGAKPPNARARRAAAFRAARPAGPDDASPPPAAPRGGKGRASAPAGGARRPPAKAPRGRR
jgi:23S rRNA pseudouridine2605 synthase